MSAAKHDLVAGSLQQASQVGMMPDMPMDKFTGTQHTTLTTPSTTWLSVTDFFASKCIHIVTHQQIVFVGVHLTVSVSYVN